MAHIDAMAKKHDRPGLWGKRPQGHGRVVEPCDQTQAPTSAKAPDQAQARGAPRAVWQEQGRRHSPQGPGGARGVGPAPEAQPPQGRDGDGPPAWGGPLQPCASQARRPYQPASLAAGGTAVRLTPGAV